MGKKDVPFVIGNWKMHGNKADVARFAKEFSVCSGGNALPVEVAICPPAYLIDAATQAISPLDIEIGAQTCHHEAAGAYTGEMSANALKDLQCKYVIIGHSERRMMGETSEDAARKAAAAIDAGLIPIICVGETLVQRENGEEEAIIKEQLAISIPDNATPANSLIAYEPVWAIGTGKTATTAQIEVMHILINTTKERYSILYGGSVKPDGAKEICACQHVDGVLVGGASLEAKSFWDIIKAARETMSQVA